MVVRTIVIIFFVVCEIFIIAYTRWLCGQPLGEQIKGERGTILLQPRLYRLLPLIVMTIPVFLSIWISLFQWEDWPYFTFLFLPICLICAGISISFSMWKIEIQKDKFIYRNYFGITKSFSYEDLEYKFNGKKYAYMINNKTVFIMPDWIEDGNILKRVYTKYKTAHSTKEVELLL